MRIVSEVDRQAACILYSDRMRHFGQALWGSVMHHVINEHTWQLQHGDNGIDHCLHGDLTGADRDKPLLHPKKHVHILRELLRMLLDKRLLGKVGYYLNFRSTADLDGFHQHILMYCAKRFSYTPPIYRIRNLPAAIDHSTLMDKLLSTKMAQSGALYRRFVLRLNVVSRQHLAALDYIPASFTATEAAYILDCETVALAKQFAIKPIRLRHMLNYEPSSERFNIQGILREVVKANLTIKNLSDVRARYCEAFAAVMKNIAKTMGTVEYTKAMSVFAMEQPNLQKLLSEVNDHPKEETYHFFIEMAASCAELIEIYMAGDGEAFYDGCLKLAKRYDKPKDMATVHIARGSIETITKGNLRNGAENYKLALKLLQSSGKSYQLALVYQKMGWNTFKQGYGTKAVEYYRKSLDISETAGEKYEAMTLQTLSYTGVAQVVLGNFDTAETYHTSCLQKTKRLQGEWHPKVGNVLNNIGLLYEQRGQSAKALEYFKQGLVIKKNGKGAPISIVYSLSNVANSYNAIGNYDEAHLLVNEAFDILNTQKITLLDGISLMHNTRGKIYVKEGKLKEAEESYKNTLETTRRVEQKSYVYMKRLVNLAEVQEKRKRYKLCLKTALEAMALKDETIQALPHNFIIMECLQCLSRVYNALDYKTKYMESLYMIESECYRLELVCTSQYNQHKLDQITEHLSAVHNQLTECIG